MQFDEEQYKTKISFLDVKRIKQKVSQKRQGCNKFEKEILNFKKGLKEREFGLYRERKKLELLENLLKEKGKRGYLHISKQCKIDYANIFCEDILKSILRNLDKCVLKEGFNNVIFNGEEVNVFVRDGIVEKIQKQ